MNKKYDNKCYKKLDAYNICPDTKEWDYIASSWRFRTCKEFKEYILSVGTIAPNSKNKVVVRIAKDQN